ncbi:FxSxx-COOH system tetratricopeptide repeat protein [Streptomyces sp. NPDC127098]|uniref:FxSxx-COOH system tetratricopeptide repeat protein n=1 Tax=Streptomyces sp. NPDC127098 TaxID=3347137 RepID=UPI00364F6646
MNGFPRERAPAPRDQARQATAGDPDWWEIADAAWLTATRLAAGAEPGDDRPARHQRETGQPRPAPADPAPSADAPSRPPHTPVPPPTGHTGDPAQPPPREPAPNTATAPVAPVRATEDLGAPPRASAAPSPAPVRLAKALHGLRRRVPSRSRAVLDEERTARHGITDDLWIPYLRPAGETALDLVVLADDGPTMRIWDDAVASLATEAERSGAFRDVRVVRLALPRDGEATLRWPGGREGDPAELIDARGTRVHLVVTDGLGHGWASPTADALLERLTAGGPTALVHLLPTYLWHRTSLNPFRAELAAGGFAAPNGRVGHRPPPAGADPLRPPPTPPGDPVPVPVLSLKPEPFTAWAAVVAGESGVRRALPFVLAGTLAQGTPTPGLRAPRAANQRTAAAAVARFASLASPTARRLASQLAAVPFEFDLIEELCRRAFPEARPVHIAEIMMGGLLDWTRTRHGGAPDFAPGIREALLATGSRTQLARTVSLFAELSGGRGRGASLKAALKDPEGAALPELTEENRAWLPIEIAVLKALSGPYARRAARVAGLADGRTRREVLTPPGDNRVNQGIQQAGPRDPHGGGVPTPSPDTPEISARKADQDMAPNTSATRYPRIGQPRIMGNVPPKNPNFTGRESLLTAVEQQLRSEVTAAVLPHALHGMGGVGKSQIAIEYVYRHSHEYNVIWWIPAEQDSLILGALADLARALNLDVGPQANTAVPAVREALRSGKPYDNWLLVFDNAEDIETVRGYFPTGGPGKIIVTSRNRDWERVANPLTVNVFEREESVALLQRRSRDLSAQEADELAEALGDLPLAIEQAGAWHAATGMPVSQYLTLLNERRPGILELDPSPDYPVSVAAAWNISLDRLSQTNPAARQLLEVCACMAPEPIPQSMFRGTRNVEVSPELDPILRDPVLLARATRDLSKLSLIKLDHKNGTIQLHRLMQTVLLAGLSAEEAARRRTSAQVLLAAATPGNARSTDQWPAYQALVPHVIASGAVHSADPWVRQLVDGVVRYLYNWGAHQASADLAREAWTAWQAQSGEENLTVIQMSKWLAFVLRVLGHTDEAFVLNTRALEVCRTTDVPDEELLDSMSQMAGSLRYRGAFREAVALDTEAYDRARDLFGPEDPATLAAAHNLGVSLRLVGDFVAARELDEETARQWELLYGPAHVQTLQTVNGLAIDICEAGDFSAARAMQEETYRIYRNVLGEDNAATIRAARNLAVCRRRDGLYADASALGEETLERFITRYGSDYPDTLSAAINTSVDRRLRGDLPAAHELGARVLARYREGMGDRHAYTLTAMVNHAATLRAEGDLNGADRLHAKAAGLFRETLGERHVSALVCDLGQASNHYARFDFGRARALDEATLTALAEVSGPNHPLTHVCRANLSLDLRGLGLSEEADTVNAEAVKGLSEILNPDHPWLMAARMHQRIESDLAPMPM